MTSLARLEDSSTLRRRWVTGLLLLLYCSFEAHFGMARGLSQTGAQPESAVMSTAQHSALDLISERKWIVPGRRIWIGLRFTLDPGWHIYWTNPGDSGEPPRVEWRLPAGFQVGAIQWPVPQRLRNQSLVDYGYEGEVLLPLPLYAPGRTTLKSVAIAGAVKWLVCREVCIPEHGELTLSLSVRAQEGSPDPHWEALFVKARAHLPKNAPKYLKASIIEQGDHFLLILNTRSRETEATFFPLQPLQIENSAPQKVSSSDEGIRLELRKSEQLMKLPARITGVVVLGRNRAFLIDAPVIKVKPKQ